MPRLLPRPQGRVARSLGEGQGRSEAWAFNAQQVKKSLWSSVLLWSHDDKVCRGIPWCAQFGPNAAVVRYETAVLEAGPVVPNCVVESLAPRRIHLVIICSRDPLHVWSESALTSDIDRGMDPEPGRVRRWYGIDEVLERRGLAFQFVVVQLGFGLGLGLPVCSSSIRVRVRVRVRAWPSNL